MAVASAIRFGPHTAEPGHEPGSRWRGPVGCCERFLTLREGSIIVVTVITIVYF